MKKRILIVEDNIALSHIQKDWLEREGYSVATAMNEPFPISCYARNGST